MEGIEKTFTYLLLDLLPFPIKGFKEVLALVKFCLNTLTFAHMCKSLEFLLQLFQNQVISSYIESRPNGINSFDRD